MIEDFKNFALNLAHDAGEIMRHNFTLSMKKEWKHDHSPVTATDLEINKLVLEKIKASFPDHDLLSEEGDSDYAGSEYLWVCDPVDGTHNFSHGIPTSTFVLALLINKVPTLCVIYDPFLHRIFYAEKDNGATMNGKPIYVSESQSVSRTVVGLGKWNDFCNLFPVGHDLNKKGVRLVTGLSVNYMGALVAVGEMSAVIFGGRSLYDNIAVKLLVEEAGGRVTNLLGEEQVCEGEMKGQVASNGAVHDEILEIIRNNI